MTTAPNTAPLLAKLLEKQHQTRSPHLFKSGIFTLIWRTKVGSFPAPDLVTLISAGEPCGRWDWSTQNSRDFGELNQRRDPLPLNGYIPGSAIRGVVRAWAMQQPDLRQKAIELLGHQFEDKITAGKIEFLDAWTDEPTTLTKDVANPQEDFQVFHTGKTEPHALYTLGDGIASVTVRVAIRGIPGRAKETGEEVNEVWEWIEKALGTFGIGGRTTSGYGAVHSQQKQLTLGLDSQEFLFQLYSQGTSGPDLKKMELRPSHWRGWLRSWTLRFLLGVMSENNARITIEELFGTLTSKEDELMHRPAQHRKGCIRLQMAQQDDTQVWGSRSEDEPCFYGWYGQLWLTAPENLLKSILLPIIKFAVSVGGVGRGWRRPLHQYKRGSIATRGTYLTLSVVDSQTNDNKTCQLLPSSTNWTSLYSSWVGSVKAQWGDRVTQEYGNINAEIFSPQSCAVYVVPGTSMEPIQQNLSEPPKPNPMARPGKASPNQGKIMRSQSFKWHDDIQSPGDTRGRGMDLIYQPMYKGQRDVGGNAAQGDGSHCSWVCIRQVPGSSGETQEIVCLFMGGQAPNSQHLRSQFLKDLDQIGTHLFGVRPPS